MQTPPKEWLVRTRNGEILGPFSRRELLEELKRAVFSVEDEIATTGNRWFSAQNLSHHDAEEFTLTSTRSQTFTRSTIDKSAAPKSTPVSHNGSDEDEFTPTPDFPKDVRRMEAPRAPAPARSTASHEAHGRRGSRPWITFALALGCAFAIFSQWRLSRMKAPAGTSPLAGVVPSSNGDSPVVRRAYEMISRGQNLAALKELAHYHEKNANSSDLEYLIPYSALLVTEGEALPRARKYLEQVLASNANLQMKAHAHHWMGYLMLTQDEGDMGESHFLEALQLNPKDPAARFNLGRAYLKQERYSQALDYLQLAELELPGFWLVHIYKGRAKAALGNKGEAQQAFKAAVQAAPDRWITYIYYALFLAKENQKENAQAVLHKMLVRDPHYELHSPPPMGFFQEKVNYTEYLTAFNHVMEGGAQEDRELGKLYLAYLQTNGAGNEGRRIEALGEKGNSLAKVVALKVVLDRNAENTDLRTAVERLPADLADFGYYAFVLRGEAKIRLGSEREAQEDLQHALSLEPQAAVAHWALANLFKRTRHPAEAESEMKSLLGYHPNYIPAIVSTRNF